MVYSPSLVLNILKYSKVLTINFGNFLFHLNSFNFPLSLAIKDLKNILPD